MADSIQVCYVRQEGSVRLGHESSVMLRLFTLRSSSWLYATTGSGTVAVLSGNSQHFPKQYLIQFTRDARFCKLVPPARELLRIHCDDGSFDPTERIPRRRIDEVTRPFERILVALSRVELLTAHDQERLRGFQGFRE